MDNAQAVRVFIRTQENHPTLKGCDLLKVIARQEAATGDIPARAALRGGHSKPRPNLDEAAEAFISANPQAWEMFKHFTWQAIFAGRQRLGIALIFERMRWETMLQTKDADGLKLNNNHKAHFARRFMLENPQAGAIFTTRKTDKEKSHAA